MEPRIYEEGAIYPSPQLKYKLSNAITTLAPFYGIAQDELKSFPKPKLKRVLRAQEYPEHSRLIPAYSFLDNFFYFPLRGNIWYGKKPITFSSHMCHHEAGHYLHNMVNTGDWIIQGLQRCIETGKRPDGHRELTELVAEYGNLVRLKGNYEDPETANFYREELDVYFKYGNDFLPILARMNLEEAKAKNLLGKNPKYN